ncbi:unnamed protein product [Cuscuta epithymum]|uniref:Uncharacterized protein n=1 Tax=Cuscuta epithymum TaxID=186058 RepID=A0AAV0GAL5_9ASTE|nr:unnamed protein product [Cuscuta epithymum]
MKWAEKRRREDDELGRSAQERKERRIRLLLCAGCCIPLQSCNFTFVSLTYWTASNNQTAALDAECARWNNDQSKLCLDCNSCKAGVLVGIRNKLIIACIVLAVFYLLAFSACIIFVCVIWF